MQLVFSTTIFLILFLILAKPSFAVVRCETQYGGREVCVTTGQLQVDKEVFDPQNNKFVDNLGINDHKFAPSDLIAFRIKVKNVGDATFSKVTVLDTPQANFFELATGALMFDLTDLKVGETQEREIKLRVLDASKLPQNNVICVINSAEVSSGNERDKDTTQLCLERKVLGVEKGALPPKEMPKTGFGTWLLALLSSVLTLATGVKLVRFAKQDYSYGNYSNFTFEDRLSKKREGVST